MFLLPCIPPSTKGKVVFYRFCDAYLVEYDFRWGTYLLSKYVTPSTL